MPRQPRTPLMVVRVEGVVSRRIGDEYVVLDTTGHAHQLSGLAAGVWAVADGEPMPDAPHEELAAVHADLVGLGLLRATPGASRRAILRRGGLLVAGTGIVTIALPMAQAAASAPLQIILFQPASAIFNTTLDPGENGTLRVKVIDGNNNPVSGVNVDFHVVITSGTWDVKFTGGNPTSDGSQAYPVTIADGTATVTYAYSTVPSGDPIASITATIRSNTAHVAWATHRHVFSALGTGTGSFHVLAISRGLAYAWGRGTEGQLGTNSVTNQARPTAVNTTAGTSSLAGKTVTAVAQGTYHSLAVANGTVHAWGRNTSGQLGDGSTIQRNVPVAVNTTAGTSSLAGKSVMAVAGAGSSAAAVASSVALASDGSVHAWGDNSYGQLGTGGGNSSYPVAVPGTGSSAGRVITAISAGALHVLALGADGKVYSWGYNGYGQLGNLTATTSPTIVPVTTAGTSLAGKTVKAIAAGYYHSLALATDGTLHAWGENIYGQLGNGATLDSEAAVAVTVAGTSLAGKTIVAIAANNGMSMALASDGTVHTWGRNDSGQLGNGTTTNSATAGAVTVTGTSLAGRSVSAISAAEYNGLALDSGGRAHAWGNGGYGTNGNGSSANATVPTAVDMSLL